MDSPKNDTMRSYNTHTSKNKKQFTRNHNSVEFISDVEVVSYIIILFSFIYHFCFKKRKLKKYNPEEARVVYKKHL